MDFRLMISSDIVGKIHSRAGEIRNMLSRYMANISRRYFDVWSAQSLWQERAGDLTLISLWSKAF